VFLKLQIDEFIMSYLDIQDNYFRILLPHISTLRKLFTQVVLTNEQ